MTATKFIFFVLNIDIVSKRVYSILIFKQGMTITLLSLNERPLVKSTVINFLDLTNPTMLSLEP
jgi:hypothetical protein